MPLPSVASPIYTETLPGSKKKIEYRPMLVGEEKIILMALEGKKLTPTKIIDSISAVLRAITFEKLDLSKLPTVDIEFLLLKLRIASKGKYASLTFNCLKNLEDENGNVILTDGMPTACGKSKVVKFDLEQVSTTPGPDSNRIMVNDTIGLTMNLPSYNLTQKLTDRITSQNKSISDLTELVIYECIETIFNGDDVQTKKDFTFEEFTDFYNKLPTSARESIEAYFAALPKMTAKVQYECACGKYKDEITVEGIESFLG